MRFRWLLFLDNAEFKVISDMVRIENGKKNYLAGVDLLKVLFHELKYRFEVLLFCKDTDYALKNCNQEKIIGNYKITNK